MYVTKHAEARIIERTGINKKAVFRNAENAIERGYDLDQTKGALAYWAKAHTEYGFTVKIYGNYLYVFSNECRLITLIPIPAGIFLHINKYIEGKTPRQKPRWTYTMEDEYYPEYEDFEDDENEQAEDEPLLS